MGEVFHYCKKMVGHRFLFFPLLFLFFFSLSSSRRKKWARYFFGLFSVWDCFFVQPTARWKKNLEGTQFESQSRAHSKRGSGSCSTHGRRGCSSETLIYYFFLFFFPFPSSFFFLSFFLTLSLSFSLSYLSSSFTLSGWAVCSCEWQQQQLQQLQQQFSCCSLY